MRITRGALALTTALVLAAPAFAQSTDGWTRPAGKDWPTHSGDWSNTRHTALKQINLQNVKQLGAAWVQDFASETSRSTPIVSGGKMFVTAGTHVYALDPKTGAKLWTAEPSAPPSGMYKGVAVGEGLVYVGLSNARIAAFSQADGKFQWEAVVGDNPPLKGQAVPAGPVYVDGLIISGLANGDYGLNGRILAFDAKTGKQKWRFNVIPGPGEKGHETWPTEGQYAKVWERGGGGVWTMGAADPKLGLVYFGIGNPIPQWGGEERAGDNLYSGSVVALDIRTGKLRWHYQLVHHDIWEQDVTAPVILYDAKVGGRTRAGLGVMRADGYLFLLDRATGKPLLPAEERPVPQNAKLHTSPTQPYPVGADQIGPACMPAELNPVGYRSLCGFDPVDIDMVNTIYPLIRVRAAPLAYNPDTGLFYATAAIAGRHIRRFEDSRFFAGDNVAGKKTYGMLAAVDGRTGKIAWQKKMPYRIENGSGFSSTAGGLLFHGEPDGNLQVYNAATGDLLWQFQTGAGVGGSVSFYELDGAQHATVFAGNSLWSFKLGGTVAQRPAPPPPPTETPWVGRVQDTDKIATAGTVLDYGLEKQREAFDEFAILPARSRVKAGSKVTFTNQGKEMHSLMAADGSWSTGPIAPGAQVSLTFDKPGTVVFLCKEHPWSQGQMTVQ